MSTGFMAAENAAIPIGGPVFALGPIGMMAVAGAKLRGPGLIGIDSVPIRQELARFYGTNVIVDFTKEDTVTRIMEFTGGRFQHGTARVFQL